MNTMFFQSHSCYLQEKAESMCMCRETCILCLLLAKYWKVLCETCAEFRVASEAVFLKYVVMWNQEIEKGGNGA